MAKAIANISVSVDIEEVKEWMKSADIVEVVRCKDCEYWRQDGLFRLGTFCELTSTDCEADHYCGWGEKKE